jgi:hypothetical protein
VRVASESGGIPLIRADVRLTQTYHRPGVFVRRRDDVRLFCHEYKDDGERMGFVLTRLPVEGAYPIKLGRLKNNFVPLGRGRG